MADEKLEIELKVVLDQFKNGMAEAEKRMSGFSALTVAKGVLISDAFKAIGRATITFGVDAIKSYAQQEVQLTRLAAVVGKDTARAFQEYANALQKTTSFSDDQILVLQTQLSQFGVLPGSVKDSTKAILDYAAATGKDASEAGNVFTMALSGQSRELKKMGLELIAGETRTQNLARVTEFLEKRFGGMSETIAGTMLGTFENFKNRLGDVQKRIGEELAPAVIFLTDKLKDMLAVFDDLNGKTAEITSARVGLLDSLRKERDIIIERSRSGEKLEKVDRDRLIAIGNQIKWVKGLSAEQDVIIKQQGQMVRGMRQEMSQADEMVAKMRASFERTASFSDQLRVKMEAYARSWSNIFANSVDGMVNGFSRGIADMITEGGKFRDMMANLGRQIVNEFISQTIARYVAGWIAGEQARVAATTAANAAISASNAATATGGVAGGVGAGGAGLGSGLIGAGIVGGAYMFMDANDAGIQRHLFGQQEDNSIQKFANDRTAIVDARLAEGKTTKEDVFAGFVDDSGGNTLQDLMLSVLANKNGMAEGGMITEPSLVVGSKTGRLNVIGEAGPEAVVPGGGGGMTVNVSISGMFLEASPAKWEQLVREHIIIPLQRYRQKTAGSTI